MIAIIVENSSAVMDIQTLLSEFSEYVIGRMGIPYKEKNVRIISVAVDAPVDKINAITGKIGKLRGVVAKTVYSNV